MNDILFVILKAVLTVAIMVGIRYFVPWAKNAIDTSKLAIVAELIETAVKAAEQTITGTKTGAEKKAIVVKFIKEQLTAKNISISDEQIDALIEAAVYAMNQAKE